MDTFIAMQSDIVMIIISNALKCWGKIVMGNFIDRANNGRNGSRRSPPSSNTRPPSCCQLDSIGELIFYCRPDICQFWYTTALSSRPVKRDTKSTQICDKIAQIRQKQGFSMLKVHWLWRLLLMSAKFYRTPISVDSLMNLNKELSSHPKRTIHIAILIHEICG